MLIHELFTRHLRTGNWLYKIAWSIRTSKKFNCIVSYPEHYWLWKYIKGSVQTYRAIEGKFPEDLVTFEPSIDYILRPRKWEYNLEEEEWIDSHSNDFKNKTVSIALNFFFQSFLYFKGYEQDIFNFLEFKEEEVEKVKSKYCHFFTKPSILISIRLGDFINHGDFYQIPHDWYIKSLTTYFPNWKDYNVCVTSDDIEMAKKIFAEYPFLYAEPNQTHTHENRFKMYHQDASEHLILGTLFDNYIISQSTFSVWQAWLGSFNKPNSKVIHSGKVFSETGNMKHVDTSNYYPSNWIKCEI